MPQDIGLLVSTQDTMYAILTVVAIAAIAAIAVLWLLGAMDDY